MTACGDQGHHSPPRPGDRRQLPIGLRPPGLRGQPAGRRGRAGGGRRQRPRSRTERPGGRNRPQRRRLAGHLGGGGGQPRLRPGGQPGRPAASRTASCWCATPTSWSRPGRSATWPRVLAEDPSAGIVGPAAEEPRRHACTRRPAPSRPSPTLPATDCSAWSGRTTRSPAGTACSTGTTASRRTVDWVSGACFLIRRQAWAGLDGFDPRYFMYMEDVDLCWRAGRQGWRVVYEPAGQVVHAQGVSADTRPYRMILAHHRSMLKFAWQTGGGVDRALFPLVAAGVVGRSAAACAAKWRDARAAGERSRVRRGASASLTPRNGKGLFKQKSGARRQHRAAAGLPGAAPRGSTTSRSSRSWCWARRWCTSAVRTACRRSTRRAGHRRRWSGRTTGMRRTASTSAPAPQGRVRPGVPLPDRSRGHPHPRRRRDRHPPVRKVGRRARTPCSGCSPRSPASP